MFKLSVCLLAVLLAGCVPVVTPRPEPEPAPTPTTPFTLGTETSTGTVGPDGGVLALGDLTITVPAGALLEPTALTLTRVSQFPLPGFTAGVHFEPEGLTFLAPVSVRLAAGDWAFGYRGAGEDAHLLAFTREGGALVVKTMHFSGFGVGDGATPGTSPAAAEGRADDAQARGDGPSAEAALAALFVELRATLQSATQSRSALGSAIFALVRLREQAQRAGLSATFPTELAAATALVRQGFLAERDRIFAAATTSGRWQELLDLETFLIPRAQVLGLTDDADLSTAGLAAAMPLKASLTGVALTYSSVDQQYHLVGEASVLLPGHAPIILPEMEVSAAIVGGVRASGVTQTENGAFDLPFRQNRESMRVTVTVQFTGLPALPVIATQTVSADNEAPLSVSLVSDRSVFDVSQGATLVATVSRGAGVLGFAGTVEFVVNGPCTLGAPTGTPDQDGRVSTTVTCTSRGSINVSVSASHRGEQAFNDLNLSVDLDCSAFMGGVAIGARCTKTADPDSCGCFVQACNTVQGQCGSCGFTECGCYNPNQC